MSKKKMLYLLTSFVVVVSTLILLIYIPVFKAEDAVYSKFFFANGKEEYANKEDNTKLIIDTSKKYGCVGLNTNWKNPLNPTYSVVHYETEFDGQKRTVVDIIKLKRDSVFDFSWEIDYPTHSAIVKNSFENVLKEVESVDFSKEKNSDYISTMTLPTPSELEEQNNSVSYEQEQSTPSEDEIIIGIVEIKIHQFSLKIIEEGKISEYQPEWSEQDVQDYVEYAEQQIEKLTEEIESTGTSLDTWAELYKEQIKEGLPFEEE